MSRMRWIRASAVRAIALLALACGGMSSMAAPLPNPSTSVLCSVEGNTFFQATECAFGGGSGIPSQAFATVVPGPTPTVSAEASSTVEARLGAGSSATALYWFQVEGPTLNERVPLLMDIFLQTSGSDNALGIARIIVNTTIEPFAFVGSVCQGMTVDECDLPASLEATISIHALTGSRLDTVTLFAQAQAFVDRSFAQVARAIADPYIYVDPTFPNADQYRVVVSPGFENLPPVPAQVPVPAVLWLIVPGLCLLGWHSRAARAAASGAG